MKAYEFRNAEGRLIGGGEYSNDVEAIFEAQAYEIHASVSVDHITEGIRKIEFQRTLLLGAEGWSEAQGQPWLREATPEEALTVSRQLDRIDRNGRPYWFVTIDFRQAPRAIVERAMCFDRVVRLIQ